MKVLKEGHLYELMCFDPPVKENDIQTIQFIEKENDESGNLATVNNGTTNEEVLEVLIDRMQSLQNKFPCRENAIVITKLQECLFWLNYRTKLRREQNVEGAAIAHKS